jgi:thiamine kinase-like enzyme
VSLFALTHHDLGDLFDQIPLLATRTGIEDLTGGLTNRNVKVTTPDGVYVARCSDREHNPLGIDRDAEHVNSERAERAGVGAPVLDYRPDLGVLVIGWLEGTTLDNEAFTRPDVVRRAAGAIRMLHEGEPFDGDFDMFRRQQGYLTTCRDHGHRMPDDYLDHADAFDRIRRALAVNDPGTVPCNNDACFELGNTVQECHLDLDRTEVLVAGYFGEVTRARLARVRLQAVVAQYGWTLWGCIQHAASPLEFDFWEWAMERYDGAVAAMSAPDFEDLLDDAAGTR